MERIYEIGDPNVYDKERNTLGGVELFRRREGMAELVRRSKVVVFGTRSIGFYYADHDERWDRERPRERLAYPDEVILHAGDPFECHAILCFVRYLLLQGINYI